MSLMDHLPALEQAVKTFLVATPTPIDTSNAIIPVTAFHDPHHRNTAASRLDRRLEESTAFLSRLDNAIHKLQSLRRLHEQRRAALHNARHVPLLGLPTEIFGRIFEMTMPSVTHPPWRSPSSQCHFQAYHLAHVCSQWRDIAMHWAPLFTNFNFDWLRKHSRIDDWMEKSGQVLLNVYEANDADRDMVERIAPRIRFLVLHDGLQNVEQFERLETLAVDGMYHHIFQLHLPALQQLLIFNGLHPWENSEKIFSIPSPVLLQLRFLSLNNVHLSHGILPLVASLEQLEALELWGVNWDKSEDGDKEPKSTEWVSSSLRHLSLKDSEWSSLEEFFHPLSCPSLETFYYDTKDRPTSNGRRGTRDRYHDQGSMWSQAVRFLKCSPTLHTLILTINYIPSCAVNPLSHLAHSINLDVSGPILFPNIRKIRLVGNTRYIDYIDRPLRELICALQNRNERNHSASPASSPSLSVSPPSPTPSTSSLSPPSPSIPSSPLSSLSHSETQPVKRVPIRLEIESPELVAYGRLEQGYEELVDSVEQIFHPSLRPHPDWRLS